MAFGDLPLGCSFLDFSNVSEDGLTTSSMEDEPVDNYFSSRKSGPTTKVRGRSRKLYYTESSVEGYEFETMAPYPTDLMLTDIRVPPSETGSWLARPESQHDRLKAQNSNSPQPSGSGSTFSPHQEGDFITSFEAQWPLETKSHSKEPRSGGNQDSGDGKTTKSQPKLTFVEASPAPIHMVQFAEESFPIGLRTASEIDFSKLHVNRQSYGFTRSLSASCTALSSISPFKIRDRKRLSLCSQTADARNSWGASEEKTSETRSFQWFTPSETDVGSEASDLKPSKPKKRRTSSQGDLRFIESQRGSHR